MLLAVSRISPSHSVYNFFFLCKIYERVRCTLHTFLHTRRMYLRERYAVEAVSEIFRLELRIRRIDYVGFKIFLIHSDVTCTDILNKNKIENVEKLIASRCNGEFNKLCV